MHLPASGMLGANIRQPTHHNTWTAQSYSHRGRPSRPGAYALQPRDNNVRCRNPSSAVTSILHLVDSPGNAGLQLAFERRLSARGEMRTRRAVREDLQHLPGFRRADVLKDFHSPVISQLFAAQSKTVKLGPQALQTAL